LSALLSQILVVFTIELDNVFEQRMHEAGQPASTLSLVVWSNLMRFLAGGSVPVNQLASDALMPPHRIRFELGCLERWGFVTLQAAPGDQRHILTRARPRGGRLLRDGWGSARKMRSDWLVRLTDKGQEAARIWPALFGEIERRWQERFGGDEIARLRRSLEDVLAQVDLELPQGLPGYWDVAVTYPVRGPGRRDPLPLPALLSQLLLLFTIEFDRESRLPLILCANTLRVLGEQPVSVADLPRLTGGSPETCGIGWQIKPYVRVESAPGARRGKVVTLTPPGLEIQQTFRALIVKIEKRWAERFGKEKLQPVRESLEGLFVPRRGERLLLAEDWFPSKEPPVRANRFRRSAAVISEQRRDSECAISWPRPTCSYATPPAPCRTIPFGI
jgi:DNA-binding MarR family transcriptional regulator